MNKGFAFGFLLVLLVVILGFYVAYTAFMSARETLLAQPTALATGSARATPRPTRPVATATVTATLPITGSAITATQTGVAAEGTTEPVTGTVSPPAPTPEEPTAVSTSEVGTSTTPTPVAALPTPIPISQYEFRLGGPASPDPTYPNCCYIAGIVRDASGQGLEGVRVQIYNQWTAPVTAVTKGGVDLGKYDFPLGWAAVTWTMVVVDANDKPISPQVSVPFDPNKSNAFRVDWQRTH